jgi:hypothetical protein
MTLTAASYAYFAVAGGIIAFSFWKPQFPRMLDGWLRIRDEKWLRRFLLVYWIAVPVVMYRFLQLGLTASS